MKITFEDKLHGASTWEPATDEFEIAEILQAVKGMLVTHGYHECVVDEAFIDMSSEIKEEYQEEDDTEVIDPMDPVDREIYKAVKSIKDIAWKRKSLNKFKEFSKYYRLAVKKCNHYKF